MEPANPVSGAGAPLFSAVITPHRSLSRRGFVIVMAALGGISFFAGTMFLMIGAWPVLGFFGLDVVLVWWAFRANYRAARAREIVEVSDSEIRVLRTDHHGTQAEWRFNPYWARLSVKRDSDGMIETVAFVSHGRACEIAGWLSPPEKADFATALDAALAEARRGPVAPT